MMLLLMFVTLKSMQRYCRLKIAVFIFTGAHAFCYAFYPTALKGCRGIVFTHGVQMGGRASGRAAGKVCLGCISETVRCRKLILGRDIG